MKDLVERKKLEHERALNRHAELGSVPKFRMRLRVRLGTKLNSKERVFRALFLGRRVYVRAHDKSKPLDQADWIVITANRFKTIDQAVDFGLKFQTSLSVACALKGIAVDVGVENNSPSSVGDIIRTAVAKVGRFIFDDVHGVDVLPDTPSVLVMAVGGTATTSMAPNFLTDMVSEVGRSVCNLTDRGREAALLMNAAFLAGHPVAMVTLAVAAVEMLATSEKWNSNQKRWIKDTRDQIGVDESFSFEERSELRRAVEGILNFGALAKVKRLIAELSLEELWPRWSELYGMRSKLFHGGAYLTHSEVQKLGTEAHGVCKTIVDRFLQRELGVDTRTPE